VIDKPAGTAVHGGSGVSFGVIEALRAARPEARFLELAHRLDRDTSGLLLIAKKRNVLLALHEMGHSYTAQAGLKMHRYWMGELFVNIILHTFKAQ
jgi:23S rRNA-/tRNA-specific pseudouridylate synthase